MTESKEPKLEDVIVRRDIKGVRGFKFPQLCGCSSCGGYTGIFWEGKTQFPELAAKVALVQHGYTFMPRYDNSPPDEGVCDCEEKLEALKELVKALPAIVADTGWQSRKAGRCITDYTRLVQFKRVLTQDELSTYCSYLRRHKCPGYTGVSCTVDGTQYTFRTTWDSSD